MDPRMLQADTLKLLQLACVRKMQKYCAMLHVDIRNMAPVCGRHLK